jgi:hypothetical protein
LIVVLWESRQGRFNDTVWQIIVRRIQCADCLLGDVGSQAGLFSWARVLDLILVHRDRAGILASILGFLRSSLHGRLNWRMNGSHQLGLVGKCIVILSEKSSSTCIKGRIWVWVNEKAGDGLQVREDEVS